MIKRMAIQSRGIVKRMFRQIVKPLQSVKRRLDLFQRGLTGDQLCPACGYRGRFHYSKPLWPDLIAEWELSPDWVNWFNLREGQSCPKCGSNLRAGKLSESILKVLNGTLGLTATSLEEAFDQRHVPELRIAEINSAGTLHQFLVKCPNL
jgi:hypothetical protein